MKVSILGPTNMKKFSTIIGRPIPEIESNAKKIGEILAKNNCDLVVVFNYSGMLKLIGDSYKEEGGKLEMLYTENDYDWETEVYVIHLKEADIKTKKSSWHDMLLSLVKDSDVIICAGLSAGVFAELGYMKWNYQEKKGKVKKLIGIKEFLKNEQFPQEISFDMKDIITSCSIEDLDRIIKKL